MNNRTQINSGVFGHRSIGFSVIYPCPPVVLISLTPGRNVISDFTAAAANVVMGLLIHLPLVALLATELRYRTVLGFLHKVGFRFNDGLKPVGIVWRVCGFKESDGELVRDFADHLPLDV